jgi:hypothetical protein
MLLTQEFFFHESHPFFRFDFNSKSFASSSFPPLTLKFHLQPIIQRPSDVINLRNPLEAAGYSLINQEITILYSASASASELMTIELVRSQPPVSRFSPRFAPEP